MEPRRPPIDVSKYFSLSIFPTLEQCTTVPVQYHSADLTINWFSIHFQPKNPRQKLGVWRNFDAYLMDYLQWRELKTFLLYHLPPTQAALYIIELLPIKTSIQLVLIECSAVVSGAFQVRFIKLFTKKEDNLVYLKILNWTATTNHLADWGYFEWETQSINQRPTLTFKRPLGRAKVVLKVANGDNKGMNNRHPFIDKLCKVRPLL